MSAVQVSDETISAVVVGLAHHELIGAAARAGMADALASENRWHVHDSWGEPASLFPPAVSGHPWRWRPLAPPVELLTRLDFLRANLPGRDYFAGLDTLDRLDRLHDATVRRLDGYGLAAWQR
jgi:hypothetical protein